MKINGATGDGRPLIRWLRQRGHHLLFVITLLSLTSLVGWWAVFIRNSIHREHNREKEELVFRVQAYALTLGHQPQPVPQPGPLPDDARFEIVPAATAAADAVAMQPYWPEYAIQPRPAELAFVEDKFRRRSIMVIGEGTLLALLILISTFMLYRLIHEERRSARELQEFWSRITHEIKTPITGLRAFLETLKSQELSREELEPLVHMALRQVDRQQQLAQNILVGQRLERDAARLNPTPLALGDFLERFVGGHRSQFGERIRLQRPSPNDVWVMADPDAVHVILDNLTDNAFKYAGEGLDLQIRVTADDDEAQVSVCDNGPGFDPAQAENLFEAFRRFPGELPDGQHGTGMGLYISRSLARKMGGDLTGSSAGPRQGACFQLNLKRCPPRSA
ncbi:MAG: HAMP domain-containing histidine kinase [Acidobacteria bacterium]|nr:HAMP domain-containing histidine kinase [Acidobacteriota bacterium]